MNVSDYKNVTSATIATSSSVPRYRSRTQSDEPFMQYHSKGAVVLNSYLSDLVNLEDLISLNDDDLDAICNIPRFKDCKDKPLEEVFYKLRAYYQDIGYETLPEMSADFINRSISIAVRDILEYTSINHSLPSGFPYVGSKGTNLYFELVDSSGYNVSRESYRHYVNFLKSISITTFFENLIFLGAGNGSEIEATLNNLPESILQKVKSVNTIDMTLSGIKHTFDKLKHDGTFRKFPHIELIGQVSQFEDVKVASRSDEYYKGNLAILIGKTSGNFNFQNLIEILNGFSSDGGNVLVDFGLFDTREQLTEISEMYKSDLNKRFLLSNLIRILTDLGCTPDMMTKIYDSFQVIIESEENYSDFMSIRSVVSIPDEVNVILQDKFKLELPNQITLMDSYRRKLPAITQAFHDAGYFLNQLYTSPDKKSLFTLAERM